MGKRLFPVIFFAILVLLAGCSDMGEGRPEGRTVIKIAGSTSVAPLVKAMEKPFEEDSGMNIEIQESGSSSGIMSAIQGAAHIAMSSRDLTEEETAQGAIPYVLAIDGIAVVANPENPVTDISMVDLRKIYTGEFTNWADAGGDDAEIIVITREDGSGTRSAFEELLGTSDNELSEMTLYESSTGAIKSNVMTSKYAIGYISFGSLDDKVKALQIDTVACSAENIRNGSYTLARPYYLCVTESTPDFAGIFLEFVSSKERQKIIEEKGYIGVD